jgi:hypothetical protein
MKLGNLVLIKPLEKPPITINLNTLCEYLSWVIAPIIGIAILWGVPVVVGSAIIFLRNIFMSVVQSPFFQNAIN